MNSPVTLHVRNVEFAYSPTRPLLAGCSLEINPGDFIGIIGPNGAGKSTLFKLMTGLLKPKSGDVMLSGKPLDQYARREIARLISVVPQSEEGAFPFTVEELVMMGRSPNLSGFLALESESDREAARAALATVGLTDFAHQSMQRLSGGERQLALIARAIAQDTPLMLLDEPTASLDLAHQQQIMRILEQRHRAHGRGVVVVMHDLNLAARYCQTLAVLHHGRIVAIGSPQEIIGEQLLREVYGTELWLTSSPDGSPVIIPHR